MNIIIGILLVVLCAGTARVIGWHAWPAFRAWQTRRRFEATFGETTPRTEADRGKRREMVHESIRETAKWLDWTNVLLNDHSRLGPASESMMTVAGTQLRVKYLQELERARARFERLLPRMIETAVAAGYNRSALEGAGGEALRSIPSFVPSAAAG